jgi:hypothetical protein
MSIGNTMASAVLRSPLHGMASRSLAVLSYEGHRSGRHYSIPIQYARDDETLVIWAGRADTKTWWRNFRTPRVVSVRLRGRERAGKAHLVDDVDQRARYLRAYLERFPATTPSGKPKFFGERWKPSDAELREAAEPMVLVAVDLNA